MPLPTTKKRKAAEPPSVSSNNSNSDSRPKPKSKSKPKPKPPIAPTSTSTPTPTPTHTPTPTTAPHSPMSLCGGCRRAVQPQDPMVTCYTCLGRFHGGCVPALALAQPRFVCESCRIQQSKSQSESSHSNHSNQKLQPQNPASASSNRKRTPARPKPKAPPAIIKPPLPMPPIVNDSATAAEDDDICPVCDGNCDCAQAAPSALPPAPSQPHLDQPRAPAVDNETPAIDFFASPVPSHATHGHDPEPPVAARPAIPTTSSSSTSHTSSADDTRPFPRATPKAPPVAFDLIFDDEDDDEVLDLYSSIESDNQPGSNTTKQSLDVLTFAGNGANTANINSADARHVHAAGGRAQATHADDAADSDTDSADDLEVYEEPDSDNDDKPITARAPNASGGKSSIGKPSGTKQIHSRYVSATAATASMSTGPTTSYAPAPISTAADDLEDGNSDHVDHDSYYDEYEFYGGFDDASNREEQIIMELFQERLLSGWSSDDEENQSYDEDDDDDSDDDLEDDGDDDDDDDEDDEEEDHTDDATRMMDADDADQTAAVLEELFQSAEARDAVSAAISIPLTTQDFGLAVPNASLSASVADTVQHMARAYKPFKSPKLRSAELETAAVSASVTSEADSSAAAAQQPHSPKQYAVDIKKTVVGPDGGIKIMTKSIQLSVSGKRKGKSLAKSKFPSESSPILPVMVKPLEGSSASGMRVDGDDDDDEDFGSGEVSSAAKLLAKPATHASACPSRTMTSSNAGIAAAATPWLAALAAIRASVVSSTSAQSGSGTCPAGVNNSAAFAGNFTHIGTNSGGDNSALSAAIAAAAAAVTASNTAASRGRIAPTLNANDAAKQSADSTAESATAAATAAAAAASALGLPASVAALASLLLKNGAPDITALAAVIAANTASISNAPVDSHEDHLHAHRTKSRASVAPSVSSPRKRSASSAFTIRRSPSTAELHLLASAAPMTPAWSISDLGHAVTTSGRPRNASALTASLISGFEHDIDENVCEDDSDKDDDDDDESHDQNDTAMSVPITILLEEIIDSDQLISEEEDEDDDDGGGDTKTDGRSKDSRSNLAIGRKSGRRVRGGIGSRRALNSTADMDSASGSDLDLDRWKRIPIGTYWRAQTRQRRRHQSIGAGVVNKLSPNVRSPMLNATLFDRRLHGTGAPYVHVTPARRHSATAGIMHGGSHQRSFGAPATHRETNPSSTFLLSPVLVPNMGHVDHKPSPLTSAIRTLEELTTDMLLPPPLTL